MHLAAFRRFHGLRPPASLILLLLAACGADRGGNVAVCNGAPRCSRSEASDVVLNRYGGNDCGAAVASESCGLDAEAVRACANALEVAVCQPESGSTWDAEAALSAAGCAAQIGTLIDCHDEKVGSSGDDDDDLFDD